MLSAAEYLSLMLKSRISSTRGSNAPKVSSARHGAALAGYNTTSMERAAD
jgi:hypothetical protein